MASRWLTQVTHQGVGELGLGLNYAHSVHSIAPTLSCPIPGLKDHLAVTDVGCLILPLNLRQLALPF